MDELVEPFRRLIEDACPPSVVRAIEGGGDWRPLWSAIGESGFLDALVAEESGGVGLSLADVAPLISICGAFAVPLPVGETMVARALLAAAGIDAPAGPIVLATGAGATPLARVAEHALRGTIAAPEVIAIGDIAPTGVAHDLSSVVDGGGSGMRAVAAIVRALLIAGAAGRVLDLAVSYANDRVQFGKPIGRQQAVQQQLAILAEHAVAARIAAAIGARAGVTGETHAAGVAKHVTSTAAVQIPAIAHAVFGAIGISEEHDLHLFTRRLRGWRLADGSEGYWAEAIGADMLASARDGAGLLAFPGRR